jgi:hypothetical protein
MNGFTIRFCIWLYNDVFGFKVYIQDILDLHDREDKRIRDKVREEKAESDRATERAKDTKGSNTGINVASEPRGDSTTLRNNTRVVQPVLVRSRKW